MPRKKSGNHGKIVEAARKEFDRCGFKEASMRNIAAEAGMSASGRYKHFPSKEAGMRRSSRSRPGETAGRWSTSTTIWMLFGC